MWYRNAEMVHVAGLLHHQAPAAVVKPAPPHLAQAADQCLQRSPGEDVSVGRTSKSGGFRSAAPVTLFPGGSMSCGPALPACRCTTIDPHTDGGLEHDAF